MKTINLTNTIGVSMNRKQILFSTLFTGALFILLLIFAAGCGDNSSVVSTGGNNGNTTDNVSLSIKNDEAADNPLALTITEAKALITELEVETEPSGSSQHIRISPFVIYFNMSGSLVSVTTGNLPSGTYNKIKFKIHKPEDNEPIPDPDFRTGTSGNQRYSFIIKGTYNGNSFTYRSKRSANLVISFNSPISHQSGERNITVLVNPMAWFNNGSLDPTNPANEDAIDDNLKNSFRRAFKDDNKDGRPDDN
jgi:hypothetical protein